MQPRIETIRLAAGSLRFTARRGSRESPPIRRLYCSLAPKKTEVDPWECQLLSAPQGILNQAIKKTILIREIRAEEK